VWAIGVGVGKSVSTKGEGKATDLYETQVEQHLIEPAPQTRPP
jgi:hypothetical protein